MDNAPGLAGLFSQISLEWSGPGSHTCPEVFASTSLDAGPVQLGKLPWGAGPALAPSLFLFLTGPQVVVPRHVDSCFL